MQRGLVLTASVLSSTLGVTSPSWAGSFAASKVVSEFGASGTAAGDLDGQPGAELVDAVSSGEGRRLRIYRWNATLLTFEYFDVINVVKRGDRFGGDLELCDLDRDGWLDLVVPDSNNSTSTRGVLSWFKNPDGELGKPWPESRIAAWSGSGAGEEVHHLTDVVCGDINADGQMDVVTRDIDHGFWLHLQQPGRVWASKRYVPTRPREGLALFDPDRDGDLDVLLNGVWFETPQNPLTEPVKAHAIRGAEAWYPVGTTDVEVDNYASKVVAADFNGDGRDDVLITNAEELAAGRTPTKPKGIALYLAPADPINDTWTEELVTSEYYGWHTAEVADFEGDGDLDLVSGTAWNASVTAVFLNQGIGLGFAREVIASEPVYQGQLADFDGDGDLDLWAPPQYNAGDVLYWENITSLPGTPPPPDPSTPPDDPPPPTDPPPAGVHNVALGREVSVSSGAVGPQLTDGSFELDSRWISGSGFPQWIEIEFPQTYWLTGLGFFQQSARAGAYFVEVFTGTEWEVAAAGEAGTNLELLVDFAEPIQGDALRFTIDDGTLFLKVFELEIYGSNAPATSDPENVALDKPVTASSGTGANLLTDGRATTDSRWLADYGYPQTLEIDLGATRDVTRAALRQFAPRVDDYRWSAWSGGSWQVIATGSATGLLDVQGEFAPTKTSKVRFEALTGSYGIKAYELEVWATP